MINKVMKEYVEELNNKESNYEAILSKMKGERKMKSNMKKVLNVAMLIIVVILLGTASTGIYAKIQWDIKFKEYQNKEREYGVGTIKQAFESGYGEEVEMEYVKHDGIEAKVDSLIITDDYFEANINFNFDEDIEVNSETFGYGFAVYDENKNVYGISPRMYINKKEKRDNYIPLIYESLGIKYNKNDMYAIQYCDTMEKARVSVKDRNIISKIDMKSSKGFPKSKKIYIKVFDLGFFMAELDKTGKKLNVAEDFSITDAEWTFEIDVPDKFYERQIEELELKEPIQGVKIEKMYVTEVGLVLEIKIDGIDDIIMAGKDMSIEEWKKIRMETINITDGEGNIYYEKSMGTLNEKDSIKINYEINKNMLNKKLFLNVKIDGKQYRGELIKK